MSEAGTYALSLASAPGDVGPRPVLVEVFDRTDGTVVESGTPFTFSVAESEALMGRFAVRVSLGAAVADESGVAGRSLAAYPNPGAGAVTVVLSGAGGTDVRLAVYDALGREVPVLHEGPCSMPAGSRRARIWSGS
ncbi:hypothetical protein [Rubrivirga sp. IMCC43871]|uniref:hypothetical protein n=1 Tax=Rubrivirga sp. IMCC43871 TaxID=3391575 RepID=UPI003990396A